MNLNVLGFVLQTQLLKPNLIKIKYNLVLIN